MLEKLKELDVNAFVYLNSLGSETFDPLWLIITKQVNWIPFFLLIFYLIYKKTGGKQLFFLMLFIAALIAFTDQATNFVKHTVERPRPCNNPDINSFIRIVKARSSFSFFSGHAANTMAVATFLFLVLKQHFKYLGFLFLWPFIFAYSRIYLGLHYPGDILAGYFFGALFGMGAYLIYKKVKLRYFLETI